MDEFHIGLIANKHAFCVRDRGSIAERVSSDRCALRAVMLNKVVSNGTLWV